MTTTSKFLKDLNPSQAKAVQTIEGPVQINAVAGSGKTRVLVNRIAYMLENGIKPGNILCTTFTKKAAEEMTERLLPMVSAMQLKQITMGTFHSIAYRILCKEYKESNHPLYNAFRSRDGMLVNGSLKRFAEDVKKKIMYDRTVEFTVKEALTDASLGQLLRVVGSSKNKGIDYQEFKEEFSGKGAKMEAYIEFYERYETMKYNERKLDMDDLLVNLVALFKDHPSILKKYQGYYKYLLVDEAQDNNPLQYALIRMLGGSTNNIFIVGDDDQSMYSFRGACPEEFIHFVDNYRGVRQIALEDNYRSNPGILDVANRLIANNTVRLDKRLKAHKVDASECVSYGHYENQDTEADATVREIKALVEKEGREPKSIAILYRTNAQSRAFEDKLIMAGLPYVIHGGISFYERKEVKDILAYLQLAVDSSDDVAFKRVVNVPARYLGRAYMDKATAGSGNFFSTCMDAATKDYERRGVGDFIGQVNNLQDMLKGEVSPIDMVDYIMDDNGIGYKAYFLNDLSDAEEEQAKLENIETLKYVLSKFDTVKDFLEYIHEMITTAKIDINGVQLLTIHKSKGLEYPTVFVVGASEGTLPHFKAIEASKSSNLLAIEEERRLMYVAVTRAESTCYISSISAFNGKPVNKSRFVAEMGLKIKETEKKA